MNAFGRKAIAMNKIVRTEPTFAKPQNFQSYTTVGIEREESASNE